MANLSIPVTQNEILAQLRAVGLAKLDDPSALRTLYKLWANKGEAVAVRAFRSETAPYGGAWEDLAPATLRNSRNRNRRGKLRDTGALFDSTVGQVTDDGATVGSNLAVGSYSLLAIHNFGAPRRSIPARPVLPMNDQGEPLPEFIDEIEEITLDWFFG